MNMNKRYDRILLVLMAALVLSTIWLTSCVYREIYEVRVAQDEFSYLAGEESISSITLAMTGKPYKNIGSNNKRATKSVQEWFQRYRALHVRLAALEKQSTAHMIKDNLYAGLATHRVLALWRMTFYGHLAQIGYNPRPDSAGDNGIEKNDPAEDELSTHAEVPVTLKSMSGVISEAVRLRRVLKANNLDIYPRDEFILEAIEHLIRYEIAVIHAERLHEMKKLDVRDGGDSNANSRIVEDMIKAERELAGMFEKKKNTAGHLEQYVILNRYVMLTAAQSVAKANDKRLTDMNELAYQFPGLASCQKQFLKEAKGNGSKEKTSIVRVFQLLDPKKDPQTVLKALDRNMDLASLD
jgi:hypothetical protein